MNCSADGMNIHSLGGISQQYLQNLFGTGSTSASSSARSNLSNLAGGTTASTASDSNQLSPFAQVLANLQQLEQTSPAQYAQVTAKISTNLQAAAQKAATAGDTNLATELTTLSKDFSSASQTGQLPNAQDLAKAIAGGHHHHSASTSSASGSGSAGDAGLWQYLNQSASSQGSVAGQTLNPASIILNSLNGSTSTS